MRRRDVVESGCRNQGTETKMLLGASYYGQYLIQSMDDGDPRQSIGSRWLILRRDTDGDVEIPQSRCRLDCIAGTSHDCFDRQN